MTRIGSSDLDVLPLSLGGNTFGWTSDEDTSRSVLDAFTAAGGNFIDTADVYSAWAEGNSGGESETILGRWLAGRGDRQDLVIATKVSQHPEFQGLSASTIAAAADASLSRLQTDTIDLYYAHFDDADTPLEESLGALDALVTAGKVRYVGISNYSAERIEEWMSIVEANGFAAPVALQPHYNLVHRTDFERDLAPLAEKHSLGVIPYSSLASGFLTGKYRTREDLEGAARGQAAGGYLNDAGLAVIAELRDIATAHDVAPASVALAWLRGRPTVVAPIASARTTDQLAALLDAVALELTDEEVTRLDSVSEGIGAE